MTTERRRIERDSTQLGATSSRTENSQPDCLKIHGSDIVNSNEIRVFLEREASIHGKASKGG